jgi:hypothetical protein
MATKLTSQQKQQLNDLFNYTILPAVSEDLEVSSYDAASQALKFLVDKLNKVDVKKAFFILEGDDTDE